MENKNYIEEFLRKFKEIFPTIVITKIERSREIPRIWGYLQNQYGQVFGLEVKILSEKRGEIIYYRRGRVLTRPILLE